MADVWSLPTPEDQKLHMLCSSYHPNQADQGQGATQSEANPAAIVQGCPCPMCPTTRYNDQSAQLIIQDQDPWLPGDVFAVPYENQNQGFDNTAGIVPATNDQTYAPFVSQQTHCQRSREEAYYAHLQEAHAPLQVQTSAGLNHAQVLDMMPVTECLRSLARRFVNNPGSLVNAIRLEPAPSGRIQVVITMEIAETP